MLQTRYLHKWLVASNSPKHTTLWKTEAFSCLVDRSVEDLSPHMSANSGKTIISSELSDVKLVWVE